MNRAKLTSTERTIVGLVTMGQSPNPSLTADVRSALPRCVKIREAGALDGFSRDEIERSHAPSSRERTYFTALKDGVPILVDREFIHQQVQKVVRALEKQAAIIAMLSSAPLDDIKSHALLVVPFDLLLGYVQSVRAPEKWGLVAPTEVSLTAASGAFEKHGVQVKGKCISPCVSVEEFQLQVAAMADKDISALLLYGFRYTETMRQVARTTLGKPVIRPGAILAQAIWNVLA